MWFFYLLLGKLLTMIENLIVHFGVLYKINLKELDKNESIFNSENRNTYELNENGEIIALNLIENELYQIPPSVYEFTSIKTLILSDNKIKRINNLLPLKSLEYLDLSFNEITEIQNIDNLINLIDLDLSNNYISQIKNLKNLPNLTKINLSQNQIIQIECLENLSNITMIDLSSNQISEIKNLENLIFLYELDLSGNAIKEIQNLNLENLTFLNLYENEIAKIENLDKLTELIDLDLSYNVIEEIENLDNLINLQRLDLSGNNIFEIKELNHLINLTDLNLRNNNIFKITNLSSKSITDLDLSNNRINSFEDFSSVINSNINLQYLTIDNNPFLINIDVKVEEFENHFFTIKNELQKLEAKKKEIILPVKIMLLGNHASGKSTFLDYFLTNKITNKNESTHILKIVPNPKVSSRSSKLPKMIFYDFGGQDYYHGVYQAFLSLDTINLLFWHNNKEIYNSKEDKHNNSIVEEDINGNEIINFQKEYWLNQIAYANKQRKKYYKNTTEINYVIQTFADKFPQDFNISGDFNQLFYISLSDQYNSKKNKLSLEYLKECIKVELDTRQKPIIKTESEIRLYKHVLRSTSEDWTSVSDLVDIYNSSEDDLKAELEQLSMKGMVLYYKNVEALEDCVWLNPSLTVQKIHNLLIKENNGEVFKKDFEQRIDDYKIIEMLKANKVIFLDEEKDNEKYIIPGYLEFANEKNNDYFFFSEFDTPNFILKFLHFIPFGLINQLICHFGQNPEKKKFWRNQLIFTFKKCRVRIELNFRSLEIKIYINSPKRVILDIEKEIFLDILHIYWDNKIPKEEDFKFQINLSDEKIIEREILRTKQDILYQEINDLYISIDGKSYVHHATLQNVKERTLTIQSYSFFANNQLNIAGQIPIIDFKNFTNNINIKKMRKIFISYSRKDVDYKNELKKHLNILKTFDILDNWSCEEITIGKWNDQIQKELNESDLVIYMLSANFFGSKYILEKEVQRGMDLIDEDPSKKILCVIVSDFIGLDRLKSDKEKRSDLQQSVLRLSDYQYLPYGEVENKVTKKTEEKIISLTSYSTYGDIDSAFTQITNKILDVLK